LRNDAASFDVVTSLGVVSLPSGLKPGDTASFDVVTVEGRAS
jgi:hypothetical protein